MRNAVAHGIEAEAERTASGKPRDGRVVLEVSRRGRSAAFTCTDNGRGVDLEAVRRAAQRKGLLSEEVTSLGSKELLDLLSCGGLSTSRTVSELSGRGIGLDLLREAADRLGGHATLETRSGEGTSAKLVVPLSLASLQALAVEAAGAVVAIPLDAVRETVRIAARNLARTARGRSIAHAGEDIPFIALSSALTKRSVAPEPAVWSVVIVRATSGVVAVGVDRLLGTATVIQRTLPDLAPSTAVVAGASIDSHGNPQLILDPDGLVDAARRAGLTPERDAPRRRRVLVIDDSLTTRMLEQSILESAGYEVGLAVSGEEGLEKARLERYDLFLVDVEMPGMDGIAFIAHTRVDASLRDVPSILVTSRAEPEDRRRGREVGASGHIVKGEFDQNELLAQIRKLMP